MAPYASIRCRSEGSSRSTTGYCTSITATLPSGESVGAPALTTCGSAAAPARTADRAAAASGEASVAPGSFGVSTSCMVSPARADAVEVSSSVAWWESVPGTAKESSSFFPTALLAASTTTTSSNQAPMTCHGWRAASRPQRWRACDNMVTPSRSAVRRSVADLPIVTSSGGGDIGPGARADPADRPAAGSSIRPMSQPLASLGWVGDLPRRPPVVGRAAGPASPGPRVAGLGARVGARGGRRGRDRLPHRRGVAPGRADARGGAAARVAVAAYPRVRRDGHDVRGPERSQRGRAPRRHG